MTLFYRVNFYYAEAKIKMIKIDNYYLDEFLQQVRNRKVICFGAGKAFLDLCEKYQLAHKLHYVVDNYKYGSSITVDGLDVPVVSMNEIGNEVRESILLLTSLKYVVEITLQLDQIPLCDGLTFYIPSLFIGDSSHIVFDETRPQIIPKIIHYCWFGTSQIPKHFQNNIETWKKYCPDYKIIRWDESNYDVTKNKYMKQAYEEKKWGFVPDYARLDIINQYGGIYLDTDVELLRPLDSLLKYNMFCGFEGINYVNFGLGFGAHKRHCILEAMLNEYDQMEFRLNDGTLNLTPSPKYQTRTLEKYGLEKNGHIQSFDEFVVLSSEYFAPINSYGFGIPTNNSFSIHQYAATWFDSKQEEEKDGFIEACNFIRDRMKIKEKDEGTWR